MYFVKDVENSKVIPGVKKLSLDTYSDFRGDIWTVYTDCDFLPRFVEDKISISKHKVLRGLHGDSQISKLITCIHGNIQLAVVDLRKDSPSYGKKEMFRMGEDNPISVYVPAGCVNGHLSLSKKCIFHYKWSQVYNGAEKQVTISWDDPSLSIPWEIEDPILSDRDREHSRFMENVYL